MVLTDEDLVEIRDLILSNKVAAPARANAIAPNDVIIPPQNTGLGPEKTSFFQALSIPTKISRGSIEIVVSWCETCMTDKFFWSEVLIVSDLFIRIYFFNMVVHLNINKLIYEYKHNDNNNFLVKLMLMIYPKCFKTSLSAKKNNNI